MNKLKKDFLIACIDNLDYWYSFKGITERDKMEGLLFSTLVIIDGEGGSFPACALKPIDENGNEGEDIAGDLHNHIQKLLNKTKISKSKKINADYEVARFISTQGKEAAIKYYQYILDNNDFSKNTGAKTLNEYKINMAKNMTDEDVKEAMKNYEKYLEE